MLSESRSLTNLDSCRCSISIDNSRALHEPPWYGTVCPVVWEVGGSNPATYPIMLLPTSSVPSAPSIRSRAYGREGQSEYLGVPLDFDVKLSTNRDDVFPPLDEK